MKIWSFQGLQSIKSVEELARFLSPALFNFSQALTGNLLFKDNIKCTIANDQIFANGVELGISHNLGSIPIGFQVISKDAHADIKSGTSDWTTDRIYLVANANVTSDIIILGG